MVVVFPREKAFPPSRSVRVRLLRAVLNDVSCACVHGLLLPFYILDTFKAPIRLFMLGMKQKYCCWFLVFHSVVVAFSHKCSPRSTVWMNILFLRSFDFRVVYARSCVGVSPWVSMCMNGGSAPVCSCRNIYDFPVVLSLTCRLVLECILSDVLSLLSPFSREGYRTCSM